MRQLWPALLLAACGVPTAEHVDTRVRAVDLHRLEAEVVFEVHNPLPFGLAVTGFDYAVSIAERPLFAGEHPTAITVPARGSAEVVVPFGIAWADVRASASSTSEVVPWRVEGGFGIASPFGERRIPLGYGGELPVLRLPVVTVDDVRFGRVDASTLGLAVDLRFAAGGGYGVDEVRWAVSLGEQAVATGAATTRSDGAATVLTLEATLSPAAGWAGARDLWAGEEVIAAFTLDAILTTPLGTVPLHQRLEHVLLWR